MVAATGLHVPEAGQCAAIALDFSVADPSCTTPVKVPRRIQRRLLECRSSPPLSLEEINCKLKEADLRRQHFHECLSNKARTKPRSLSWLSQHDLGQRLEAKLNAAERNRLSLLASAQMRLARQDELRQAAKTGVKMRFEKLREELGSRVESRIQHAEANRMRLLEALVQRLAAFQDRKARSLLQRNARESKYKECIRSAIAQKRSTAERKRMVLLEAEKSRAQARVMQARRVVKALCCQRESARRKMKEQLENRLHRAKRRRAEYLRLKGNAHSVAHTCWIERSDVLSRKLARCWNQFVKSRRTTFTLANAYEALGINETNVKAMPFEQLACLIESAATLQTVKPLLDRLESRFLLYQSSNSCRHENIGYLLRRVASPGKGIPPSKCRVVAEKSSNVVSSSGAGKLSRYPVRVVLCAYMILGHPNAVFSEQGHREVTLSKAAADFAREFELLIKLIKNGACDALISKQTLPNVMFDDSVDHNHKGSVNRSPPAKTFRNQLSIFDDVWRSYLYCFVVWKVKDARLLEDDLVRAACQLELSLMQACKLTSKGETPNLSPDMMGVQEQVTQDQKLLLEKVEHLSGNEGIQRMQCALSDTRSILFAEKVRGSPSVGQVAHLLSQNITSLSLKHVDPMSKNHSIGKGGSFVDVAGSLFGGTSLQPKHDTNPFLSSQSISKLGSQLTSENELLLNEIVHGGDNSFANDLDVDYASSIKAKIKETMEKAFWDGVMKSMKEDSPDYGRITGLVKEVRDELSEMAPLSWKQDIHQNINIDSLSQVMELGTQDGDYPGRILEYALLKLRKLSAPSNEDDLKRSHDKLLNELASIEQSEDKERSSFAITMIKGLRFVLEQIQTLKKEIRKARIQMIEPFLKGSAGLEYLQKAFDDRYGPPSSAVDSLTLTKLWLSTLKDIADEELNEYVDALSLLPDSHDLPPILSLRTGGNFPQARRMSFLPLEAPGDGQPECSGEKCDLLLRLGLLRLASSMEGLVTDMVPETLQLNVLRLRSVQSQIQKIIVISTSILVLRQIIISEHLPHSSSELDTIISNSVNSLSNLLDLVPDVGVEEIIEAISSSIPGEEKHHSRKQLMATVLTKSLQDDDAVFRKVSRSIYLAARILVFAGTGHCGKRLALGILQKVGAAMLLDRMVKAADVLIIMARISMQIHGPWYRLLV